MSILDGDNPTIDLYLALFDRLSPDEQRQIMEKLNQKQDAKPSESKRKRTFEELCGVWDEEYRREDTERIVQAIHEGRMLGTEREHL